MNYSELVSTITKNNINITTWETELEEKETAIEDLKTKIAQAKEENASHKKKMDSFPRTGLTESVLEQQKEIERLKAELAARPNKSAPQGAKPNEKLRDHLLESVWTNGEQGEKYLSVTKLASELDLDQDTIKAGLKFYAKGKIGAAKSDGTRKYTPRPILFNATA